MVCPVVMYWYESWMIKYTEHQRMDAFELRRLMRVPWTARRSNQAILKEVNPEFWLEALRLKLKLQYFGHLVRRVNSLSKALMLGKIEGRSRKGQQRMRWLDGITDSMDMSWASTRRWWRAGKPGVLQSMGSQRLKHDWATGEWTTRTVSRCKRRPHPQIPGTLPCFR